MPSNDCQIPHATEDRLRFILDAQRRLIPKASIEKLAFHLVVAGLEDVPARLVGSHIASSLSKFFVVGEGMLRRLQRRPSRLGPLTERRLADAMAKAVLRDYPLLETSAYAACRQLLSTAFIMFFRSAWRNRRPGSKRPWQRIITPEFMDYERLPVKSIADAEVSCERAAVDMEPAADQERLFAQLRRACDADPTELLQAARDAAMVITAATARFPELQDCTVATEPKEAFARWVLTLVPPVLAAGLLRVAQHARTEKYGNLIPGRRETGLEAILRTVLVYWHT